MKDSLFKDVREIERVDDALQKDYSTRQIVERVWRENLYPRRKLVILALVAMLFAAATTGLMVPAIKFAIDDIFVARKMEFVYYLAGATFLITLIKSVSEYISKLTMGYLGNRFIADIRISLYEKLTYADMQWIEGTHSGLFLSNFLNDTNFIRDTASRVIIALGENLTKALFLALAMIWLDPLMSMIILLSMPPAIFFMNRQRGEMNLATKKTLQETGNLSKLISQTLRSLRVVRAYGQEEREIKRAKQAIERALEFSMRSLRARSKSGPVVELLAGVGFSGAILFAGMEGAQGRMTIGEFSAFLAAAMLLYQPLKALAQLQVSLQEGVAASGRVFGIIDQPQTMLEPVDATDLKLDKGSISFKNLDFAYEDGNPVLTDFTLDIPAGKSVALVGPSGAGKSTILNLVLRFFDPTKGKVFIDGQDISQLKLSSLRAHIGLVTQDPILFDDTLEANIAYGSRQIVPGKVEKAAKAAAADDFIVAFPQGYKSPAGEAGNNLSGGERQRVAIARAFMHDAPILLLDEPTSALDSQAEEKVQKALSELMMGRTVLIIAHRLSTIKDVDIICVLDKGRIVEQGTHDMLLASGGLYSKLYKTQFEGQGEI
ncbi:MAG: ABC transporter ATP-binding protein [bacterium]|nr:ABC transporter ATP-binding protein [bacterium]